MPYRIGQKCYACDRPAELNCIVCDKAMCGSHSLKGHLDDMSGREEEYGKLLEKRFGSNEVCVECVGQEAESIGYTFVAIYESSDPIQAEIILESLRNQGINARGLGTKNSAILGAGQFIFRQRIEVAEGQVEEAQDIIESLFNDPEVLLNEDEDSHLSDPDADERASDFPENDADDEFEDEDDEIEDDDEFEDDEFEDEDDEIEDEFEDEDVEDFEKEREGKKGSKTRRIKKVRRRAQEIEKRSFVLAGGLPVVWPGLSHAYARRPWTGMVLAFLYFLGIFIILPLDTFAGVTLLGGSFLCDLIGGQIAVREYNSGKLLVQKDQFSLGFRYALYILLAVGLVVVVRILS